jgi:hypothetical protein
VRSRFDPTCLIAATPDAIPMANDEARRRNLLNRC